MLKNVILMPLIIVITVLCGCQSASIYGSGPVTLSKSVEVGFQNWKHKDEPETFVISEDGKNANWTYCTGFSCSYDPHKTISYCEYRTGKKCFVFAESGEIVWKGYQAANTIKDGNALFTVKVLGENTVFSGRISNPGSGETFAMHIGNGNYCQGFYKTSSTFTVQLDCENDSTKGGIKKGIYKGELKSLSWKDGNIIDLKSPGRRLLEMNIIPYNGVVLSDKS